MLSALGFSRGISIMEDEGHVADHFSGISATDGTWHHIAVTWQSSDGRAILYDNGRKVSLFGSLPPTPSRAWGHEQAETMEVMVAK